MDKKIISRPAAFLDRDGVLVRDHGYVYRIEDLDILPRVPEALKLLHDHGFLLIVISNQAGVARGYYSTEDVERFHEEMQERLEKQLGFRLDGIYYCPHHPQGSVFEYAINCSCRKPGVALLEKAAQDFAIDWEHSIMVGDRASDIECGLRAGVRGIQIESDQYEGHASPHMKVRDLWEAAEWAVQHSRT
jgi:D-glycero-D-manno-heptose 1,7-bisphosphate phosphatase